MARSKIRDESFKRYSNLGKNELKRLCRERNIPWMGNPTGYMFVCALADHDEKEGKNDDCKTLEDVRRWQRETDECDGLPPGGKQISGSEEEPEVQLVSGVIVRWDNCGDEWYTPSN